MGWRVDHAEFLGAQVPVVLAQPGSDELWVALKHGHFGAKMHRSSDGGQSWAEVSAPTYPPKPDDVPDVIDPMRNTAIPWSLELIWCLERASTGRIWCGTLPGGLFSSDDKGASWQLNMPLWSLPNRSHWFGGGYDVPGIHSICIDPRDPNSISLAISCGGVWQSKDNGNHWSCASKGMRAEYMPPEKAFDPDIQDPHRMVQCTGAPDTFWVQHHNGIFRSNDHCQSWHEVDSKGPSTFGFAVTVHPHNPEIAWFVPAVRDSDRYPADGRFLVTRTQDSGASFECLTSGLPQEHAFHLVYRHGLDIDPAGDVLAMGSTTGGLWISENGGDHWETISHHLPPIYCVRFG